MSHIKGIEALFTIDKKFKLEIYPAPKLYAAKKVCLAFLIQGNKYLDRERVHAEHLGKSDGIIVRD